MTSGRNNGALTRNTQHHLLVVDDEDNVRITTAAILEQDGYKVETASDGQEALNKIRKGNFDLAIAMSVILLLITFLVNWALSFIQQRRR